MKTEVLPGGAANDRGGAGGELASAGVPLPGVEDPGAPGMEEPGDPGVVVDDEGEPGKAPTGAGPDPGTAGDGANGEETGAGAPLGWAGENGEPGELAGPALGTPPPPAGDDPCGGADVGCGTLGGSGDGGLLTAKTTTINFCP